MIDTLIIDRGHGDLDKNGYYTTAPNKMHKFNNNTIAYEGHINKKYAEAIAYYGKQVGLKIKYTVDLSNPKDLPLYTRVQIANNLNTNNNCLFISIHNNASINHNARGSEVWTSKGQTNSDVFAEEILKEWKLSFPNRKIRTDKLDGDLDKEANFYVLRNTTMPAILLEIGFFDQLKDFEWLNLSNTIEKISLGTINGIIHSLYELYGENKVNELLCN